MCSRQSGVALSRRREVRKTIGRLLRCLLLRHQRWTRRSFGLSTATGNSTPCLEVLIAIERIAGTLWGESAKGTIMEWEALTALYEAGVAQSRRDRGHDLAQTGRLARTARERPERLPVPAAPLPTPDHDLDRNLDRHHYRQRKPCMSVHA